MNSARRPVAALALLVLASGPATRAQTDSPDERLWREVQTLAAEPPSSQPYSERLAARPGRGRALLERVRTYLTLYPGGVHRDDVIRLELTTLYELCVLAGGEFAALQARVDELLAQPPSEPARAEAAYWRIIIERASTARAATQPSSAPVLAPDAALLAAYATYIRDFPHSRHTPRMASLLFDDAQRRRDTPGMQAIVRQLSADFPNHLVTQTLAARLRRAEAVGQVFWLAGPALDGTAIDTRQFAGQPVVIVVWAAFEPRSLDTARAVEARRTAEPAIAVVGVNLDDRREELDMAARDASLPWPQLHDGLGWAGEFVRTWGVTKTPCVFVIDRDGKLVVVAEDDDSWGPALSKTLQRR